jgi:hypothetical protein
MSHPADSAEFIALCIIQLVTIGFSVIIFIRSFKRYLGIDRSEKILRKSVKYFTFIFITIFCAAIFSLTSNFIYITTMDGIFAGFFYTAAYSVIIINVFCAWQFITYLIHLERRQTKYVIGLYCIIVMVLLWFYPPTLSSVLIPPMNGNNLGLYSLVAIIFAFVWGVFAFDFFRSSVKSTEKREKYRFFCMGLCGIFAFLMFPLGIFRLIYPWIMILIGVNLLYFGYNFPQFFQRLLKI